MVESDFILLGTEIDNSGIPGLCWGRELDGSLEFAGPAILRSPSSGRAEWAEKFAAEAIEKPPIKGAKRVTRRSG